MSEHPTFISGTVLKLTKVKDDEYDLEQVDDAQGPIDVTPPDFKAPKAIIPFSFSQFPFTLSGQVDTNALTVTLNVKLLGFTLGTYFIDLRVGLQVNVNLVVAKGYWKIYKPQDKKEIRFAFQIKLVGDGSYEGDYKIFGW